MMLLSTERKLPNWCQLCFNHGHRWWIFSINSIKAQSKKGFRHRRSNRTTVRRKQIMIHEDVQLLNNEPQFQSPSVTASLTMTGWHRRKTSAASTARSHKGPGKGKPVSWVTFRVNPLPLGQVPPFNWARLVELSKQGLFFLPFKLLSLTQYNSEQQVLWKSVSVCYFRAVWFEPGTAGCEARKLCFAIPLFSPVSLLNLLFPGILLSSLSLRQFCNSNFSRWTQVVDVAFWATPLLLLLLLQQQACSTQLVFRITDVDDAFREICHRRRRHRRRCWTASTLTSTSPSENIPNTGANKGH